MVAETLQYSSTMRFLGDGIDEDQSNTNAIEKIVNLLRTVPGRISEQGIKRLATRYGWVFYTNALPNFIFY